MRYVGWGGLPQAFDRNNSDWEKESQELAALLPLDDYEAARRSTQDAHYTGRPVIEAMYQGVARIGFNGGRMLEPGLGPGHFVGLMPAALREATQITGIELDQTTAAIARELYPTRSIINKGFQDVRIPNGYFDLVIGNPPFGTQSLYDPEHEDLSRFSIHNYFLAKSMEKLRPGGLMAVVVSRFFMDAADPKVREHLADRAHFLGAIRLPNTAFKENALTEVTTDIVFLQKALEGETPSRDWIESVVMPGQQITAEGQEGQEPIYINRWYADHPEMMLGRMERSSSAFRGGMVDLVPNDGEDLVQALATAITRLPEARFVPIDRSAAEERVAAEKPAIELPPSVKVGAFFIHDNGQVARRLPDVLVDHDYEWVTDKNERALERIKGMVQIRTTLRDLMEAEQDENTSDDALAVRRQSLNGAYDHFVAKYGFVSSQANRLAMVEDPDYPLLQALEVDYDRGLGAEAAKKQGVPARAPSAKKAAIFSKRVVRPRRSIERVETARDALVVSMNERGRVDLDFMVRICDKTQEELVRDLAGLVFLDPVSKRWETRDKYLAGDVKAKLRHAEAAAATADRFRDNAIALRAVQPADIEAVDIAVQLGSPWVPASDVAQFVRHLIGDVHINLSYQESIGQWLVKIGRGNQTTCCVQWGTEDKPANELIGDILCNRQIRVLDRVGTNPQTGLPQYAVNEQATAAANQKADEIRQAFVDWIWEDKDRRDRLVRTYNDKFNTNVAPHYDGSHLELPGSSPLIQLRSHQKNAIWRGIQEGSTLFDHVVGAGKTYEMIATAIESRRMGLINKPMFVVPNHLLLQWKDAFYALYPSCTVLVAEKTDFEKDNRQRLFSKIATGDWDAVVVAHSSFKKIAMPNEMLEEILHEQIDDLTSAILQAKRENGDRITIKEMEKTKERMTERLKRASETGTKDQVVTFADLGVDALFVDELHEFKNLFISTSLSRISGLGNLAGSEKAFDLFVKGRYIQKKNQGRGFYGGTGTPISNTIAEMYTNQRYFSYDDLKARGLAHFDAWASVFGQVVSGWELDATGVNYKLNSRFSKFRNVPELVAMYRTFADVVTKKDLDEQAQARGERPLTPPVKGGKPRNVVVERSTAQAYFMGVQQDLLNADGSVMRNAEGVVLRDWNPGSIIHRMENLPRDPSIDNPLKITNEARKAGLDFRLIDPMAEDFAGSKVNHAVREIYDIWDKWKERKGTQLVFCDLSTPKASSAGGRATPAGPEGTDSQELADPDEPISLTMDELLAGGGGGKFSVYNDIKQKLVDLGVPENEVRFIHDAKTDAQKAKLFAEVNRGDVRVLLGSTAKMGPGMNVQRRLVAEHHLDAPWRPSDLEQREGRIIRQGNLFYEQDPDNFEVEIIRYATKQTYDSRMWQTIEYKARGIEEFRRGDTLQRVIEDIASEAANAADMKAAASGNPLILLQVQLSAELKKIEAAQTNWKRNRHTLESKAVWLERTDMRADQEIAVLDKDLQRRDANTTEEWRFEAQGKAFGPKERQEVLNLIAEASRKAKEDAKLARAAMEGTEPVPIGTYRGFKLSVEAISEVLRFGLEGAQSYRPEALVYGPGDEFKITGFFTRIDNMLDKLDQKKGDIERRRQSEKEEFAQVRRELGKPFAQEEYLKLLRDDFGCVLAELRKMQADENYVTTWLPKAMDPPKELLEIVEAAKAQGGPAGGLVQSRPEVEQAMAFLRRYSESKVLDEAAQDALAIARMTQPELDGVMPYLVEAMQREPELIQPLAHCRLGDRLHPDLMEAVTKATGYYEEEYQLALKSGLMVMGRLLSASGSFDGQVVAETDRCVLQAISPGVAVIHRKCNLAVGLENVAVGAALNVRYAENGAVVSRLGQPQEKQREPSSGICR